MSHVDKVTPGLHTGARLAGGVEAGWDVCTARLSSSRHTSAGCVVLVLWPNSERVFTAVDTEVRRCWICCPRSGRKPGSPGVPDTYASQVLGLRQPCFTWST